MMATAANELCRMRSERLAAIVHQKSIPGSKMPMPSRKISRTPSPSPRTLLVRQKAGMHCNRQRRKTLTTWSFWRRRLNTIPS